LDQFYPDNALDALYYIEMNHIKTQSIISINPYYDGKAVRTSFETTKKKKQIRNLLNLMGQVF
jgi:hypothetical protein